MATATATMPIHPFTNNEENENNEHEIGLPLTPSPSPYPTLTPMEAAELSKCAKEVASVNNQARETAREVVDTTTSAAVAAASTTLDRQSQVEEVSLPQPVGHVTFLGGLNGNVISRSADNSHVKQSTGETNLSEVEKLEARIASLEASLASLTEVCNGLLKQQQESQTSPTTPSSPAASPPHRRFDTETEALSQWPPSQQPILDSPEPSARRRRRKSSHKEGEHQSKPSKTMSMLLLDISAGESRGPSMIPFTEDLDEAEQSGGEKARSSSGSSQGSSQREGSAKELEPPPMLNEENVTTPLDSSATPSSGTSSTESSPSTTRKVSRRLSSSLKLTPQESNLECQAYTSTHLEALRLRHEAGKVRAYSFNETYNKTPESKIREHMEKRSASKVEKKMTTILSPVQNSPLFDVLKPKEGDKLTESVETFVAVLSPGLGDGLDVPILNADANGEEVKESVPVIPRKDSIASNASTKSNKSTTATSSNKPSKSGTGNSDQSVPLLKTDNPPRERSRSTVSEKDDAASTTSNALTVKSYNTAKSSETKQSQEVPADAKNKQSMKEYIINDLLNIDSRHQDGSASEDIDANMEEFLRIPFKLENLMWFSLAVCTDSFLYVWTLLPLKAIWGCVCLLCTILRPGKGIGGIRFHRRHLYALIQCLLVWFVFYHVLCPISIGKLYHWIRGQAMLKLYVLIAIVEVFDRLLCSFGQDAWDSLYWNTTRRPWHPRMLVSMIVVGVYVTIHSLFLFVHVATLSVAVNSADNALLTLLISGNFAEIKSTVFKKYNKQNLFKITTSDICERFKLALFLLLILLLNCFQGEMSASMVKEYYTMCLIVMVAELISDWIKHSFITKFNFIKSTAYFDYALILSGDVTGIGHEGLNLDYTHASVKRIGLAQIPLVCVTARYLHEALRFTIAFRGNGDVDHPMNALSEFFDVPLWKFYTGLFALMVALVGLKIGLGGSIRSIARHYLGGDVMELLERKSSSSSKKPSTPKTRREIAANRTDKKEGKKNQ